MWNWLRSAALAASLFFRAPRSAALPSLSVDALGPAPARYAWDDGSKYPGGFGPTQLLTADYWTLRARSSELFETNLYARGLIRRLITNEINTGLHLEAVPDEGILGLEEDALAEWSEQVENRFHIWEKARLCDQREQRSFGALQAQARLEALVTGDVLVVLGQDQRTQLPRVRLVSGSAVQTPLGATPRSGNRIVHGVELDALDRHQAYWIRQADGTSKRLPARGEKSGRKLAWLVYGTDKRLDDVRGKPILSLILQSLKEIDRYRDSVQRKAVINSMLAMFIRKGEEKMGTRPMTGGALRRDTVTDNGGDEGPARTWQVAEHIPGLVLDELQHGEEPVGFPSHGTDEKFGDFEEAIVQAFAWANEIPPEILRLAFSNNYSASQAAINEFKIYLNKVRTSFGQEFCQPIYEEWLVSETLTQKIIARGLLEARRDPTQYDIYGAWTEGDWSGHIKPSTDVFKQARGYKMLVDQGWITNDRASRELSGTKFSKNVKKLRRENEALVAALAPLREAAAADAASTRRGASARALAELDRVDRGEREEERAA